MGQHQLPRRIQQQQQSILPSKPMNSQLIEMNSPPKEQNVSFPEPASVQQMDPTFSNEAVYFQQDVEDTSPNSSKRSSTSSQSLPNFQVPKTTTKPPQRAEH